MENKTITSISQGSQEVLYYKVGLNGVTEIKQTTKPIEYADGGISKELVVYQVISASGTVCEIEANGGCVVYYS